MATDYVLNGEKWWASGAGDPRCAIYIVMVRTGGDGPKHQQHSMILVPSDTKGITKLRPMKVYGDDDAPHGHMHLRFEDVRVPGDNLILGEGRGFEIAQGRLGPGRIHHCMRAIGQAEMALELMCRRSLRREAFGDKLAKLGANFDIIAECRMEIEMARLLCLKAAWMIDQGDAARRRALDQPDQGGGAARCAQGHRRGGADAWRARHQPGHAARPAMDASEDAAACRRPGRRASPPGRAHRAQALYAGKGVSPMKAIIARDFAPLDQLVYADWPEPQASGRTVVIEAEAIGVNYPDGLLVQGLYQMRPPTPFVPGMEVAGRVVAVGPEVTAFRPGDRVAALSTYGSYAEKVGVDRSQRHEIARRAERRRRLRADLRLRHLALCAEAAGGAEARRDAGRARRVGGDRHRRDPDRQD